MKKKGLGIHILPSKVGSFTDICNKLNHGYGVTNKCINYYKKNGTKSQKKKAVFAENARQWKK